MALQISAAFLGFLAFLAAAACASLARFLMAGAAGLSAAIAEAHLSGLTLSVFGASATNCEHRARDRRRNLRVCFPVEDESPLAFSPAGGYSCLLHQDCSNALLAAGYSVKAKATEKPRSLVPGAQRNNEYKQTVYEA